MPLHLVLGHVDAIAVDVLGGKIVKSLRSIHGYRSVACEHDVARVGIVILGCIGSNCQRTSTSGRTY